MLDNKYNKTSQNFLPESIRLFLSARMKELLGVGLFFIGLAFLLSFVTYSPSDPSVHTSIQAQPENIMGTFGSYTSDFIFQLIGISGFLIIWFAWSWGWRYVSHQGIKYAFFRFLLFPISLIFASMTMAASVHFLSWENLGISNSFVAGSLGQALISQIASITWLQPWVWSPFVVFVFCFSMFLTTFVLSVNLNRHEWKFILKATWLTLYRSVGFVLQKTKQILSFAYTKMRRKAEAAPPKAEPKKPTIARRQKGDHEALPAQLVRKKNTNSKSKTKEDESLEIQPKSFFRLPQLTLLKAEDKQKQKKHNNKSFLDKNAEKLEKTLKDFGVIGQIVKASPGPVVTLYELEPAPGTKTSRVVSLADDIARSMSAVSARVAIVPGKNVIGIELPNPERETVFLRDVLSSKAYEASSAHLPLSLGKDIDGTPVIADLVRMPHLLVAGTTGSGKSVSINAMILSLLYSLTPEQCRLIMIDPKMLELSVYDNIPHLLSPVVTDPKEAILALKWAVREMECRYHAMSKLGVRNIVGYNQKIAQAQMKGEILTKKVQTGYDPDTGEAIYETQPLDNTPLPYIVIIVDEIADLMLIAGKEVEATIQRLAQMARAAGIHLILATQRPSVDVITGTIKANLPTRISFQVTSKIDSRTILGEQGAEQLLGMGDMLYMATGGRISRIHGPFVSDGEVEKVTNFLREQGVPEYEEAVTQESDETTNIPGFSAPNSGDELYDQAVAIICRDQKVSISYVQRQLQIGYNRAARIVEKMEDEGVVSKPNKVGKRERFAEYLCV